MAHKPQCPVGAGIPFLYVAKIGLAAILIWIVTLVAKEVEFINKINDTPVLAPNDDSILVDISQTIELPFQQDLSFSIGDGIKIGNKLSNCGVPVLCEANQFSVHLSTGLNNQIYPKLCIDGQYVLDKGLNGCGRGINLVVIDNITRSILRVSNFDTYEQDSQPLEALLLTLRVGDIVIMITFDESTKKLSNIAKLLLHDIGSNWAQNLIYRSSWYIITQKGIDGYTPYENLNLPDAGGWADSHEIRLCVPLRIKGLTVQPDPILDRNPNRVKFCAKYSQEFPLFCQGDIVNDPLIPARILKYLPISSEIMRTPIIVLTGQSYEDNIYLPLTLETIVRQPGVTTRNVIVFYDSVNCPLIGILAEVFDFMSNDLSDFGQNVDEVLRTTHLLFPDAQAFILIDVNTLLAPDFIPFMGQLLPFMFTKGSDIEAVSAWNDNGFEGVSNDTSLLYRANGTNYRPRFAAMFKRGFNFNIESNHLWSFSDYSIDNNVIIPDVSRVLYISHTNSAPADEVQEFISDFMHRKRSTNINEEVLLKTYELGEGIDFYMQNIIEMIAKSAPVYSVQHLEQLLSIKDDITSNEFFAISCDSEYQCRQLCDEFGLAKCMPHMVIPNVGSIIRFSKPIGATIILVNRAYY